MGVSFRCVGRCWVNLNHDHGFGLKKRAYQQCTGSQGGGCKAGQVVGQETTSVINSSKKKHSALKRYCTAIAAGKMTGLSYQVAPDKVSKDVLDESSTLRQTRKGQRVEARKTGRSITEYFPATIVGDVGDGREVYVRYDDVVGDVKVKIEHIRALTENPSYPNKNFRLKISNVDEFEHQAFFRAMRAGKAGLRFIAFNTEHGDKVLDADGASVSKIISDRLGADDGNTSPEERAAMPARSSLQRFSKCALTKSLSATKFEALTTKSQRVCSSSTVRATPPFCG